MGAFAELLEPGMRSYATGWKQSAVQYQLEQVWFAAMQQAQMRGGVVSSTDILLAEVPAKPSVRPNYDWLVGRINDMRRHGKS